MRLFIGHSFVESTDEDCCEELLKSVTSTFLDSLDIYVDGFPNSPQSFCVVMVDIISDQGIDMVRVNPPATTIGILQCYQSLSVAIC